MIFDVYIELFLYRPTSKLEEMTRANDAEHTHTCVCLCVCVCVCVCVCLNIGK